MRMGRERVAAASTPIAGASMWPATQFDVSEQVARLIKLPSRIDAL